MYTFSFTVGNIIPKIVKCIHSATKLGSGISAGRSGGSPTFFVLEGGPKAALEAVA